MYEPPDNKPQTKTTAKEAAKEAISSGVVTPGSEQAIRSLHFLANIRNYLDVLQYRVAYTMAACNRAGVLAGMSGGGKDGKSASPLKKTYYRTSKPSVPPPTINLPSSLNALASMSQSSLAAPSSEDVAAFAQMRHFNYNPAPSTKRHSDYRLGTGPPLAPFGDQSRVVTNYVVNIQPEGDLGFEAVGQWENVKQKSSNGYEYDILQKHFETGLGSKGTKRDLRGATQYEDDQIKRQIQVWILDTARGIS